MTNKQAVLLLDFGGPPTQEAIQPFLMELFSDRAVLPLRFGRKPLAWLITLLRLKKVKAQYRLIGGGSPLIAQTNALAKDLERGLAKAGLETKVYTAMRYTPPFVEETLGQMIKDNVHEVVAIPMFPQFSFTTTGSVLSALNRAVERWAPFMKIMPVRQWWEEEGFLFGWCEQIRKALGQFAAPDQAHVHLLFSAHSLPVQLVTKNNDPYPEQIRLCVKKILERLGLKNPWHLSYQSKLGPVEWLGPATTDKVRELGKQGVQNLVFIPISFLTDHIETLYEIDQLLIPEAEKAGVVKAVRTEALIQTPHLVRTLEKIALSRLLPLPLSR